jgi:hypothetical protein
MISLTLLVFRYFDCPLAAISDTLPRQGNQNWDFADFQNWNRKAAVPTVTSLLGEAVTSAREIA